MVRRDRRTATARHKIDRACWRVVLRPFESRRNGPCRPWRVRARWWRASCPDLRRERDFVRLRAPFRQTRIGWFRAVRGTLAGRRATLPGRRRAGNRRGLRGRAARRTRRPRVGGAGGRGGEEGGTCAARRAGRGKGGGHDGWRILLMRRHCCSPGFRRGWTGCGRGSARGAGISAWSAGRCATRCWGLNRRTWTCARTLTRTANAGSTRRSGWTTTRRAWPTAPGRFACPRAW